MSAARDSEIMTLLPDLIGQIYDATLDPMRWQAFADSLSSVFRGNTVLISQDGANERTSLFRTSGFDPAFVRSYADHYYKTNPWIPSAQSLPAPTVAVSERLVPPYLFDRSEFYNDYCRPQDLYYCVGCIAANEGGIVSGPSILRPRGEGDFRPAELAALRTVTEHFRRAMDISRKLAIATIERNAAMQGLDKTGTAAVVVDGSARILFASAAAERLFHGGHGLRATHGCLSSPHTATDRRLHEMIRRAALTSGGQSTGGGGAIALPRGMRRPLAAYVWPAPNVEASPGFSAPVAMVLIRDPETEATDGKSLRELFGLTPVEGDLAEVIVQGRTTEDFAKARGISVHTANTHLKNLMAKTKTRRQAELVSLLLRGGAVPGHAR